jgi:putative transposon-encoded protein
MINRFLLSLGIVLTLFAPALAVGPTIPGEVLIANKKTVALTGNSVVISVPAGYTNLRVVLTGRSDAVVAAQGVLITFNAIATGYDYDFIETSGSSTPTSNLTTGATGIGGSAVPGTTATTNYPGTIQIFVPNYSGTTFAKGLLAKCGFLNGSTTVIREITGTCSSTAAITSISFTLNGGGNFVSGSSATLIAE